MAGVDEVDLVVPADSPSGSGKPAVISLSGTGFCNDYDARTLILAYPDLFPFADGGCPMYGALKRMALQRYLRALLLREGLSFPSFVLDTHSICQKHAASESSRAQLRTTPSARGLIEGLSEEEVSLCLSLLAIDPRDTSVQKRLHDASAGVRALYESYARANARLIGTPESFAGLRSRGFGVWHTTGMFTAMLNLNPSELNARLCLMLGGAKYECEAPLGKPGQGYPDQMKRWCIVASNAVANNEFFRCVMDAFIRVFLGWDEASGIQVDPNCVFGPVKGSVFKFETSTRGLSTRTV